MRRYVSILAILGMLAAVPATALNSGKDILVPAAARSVPWVTDLFIMNPGDSTVSVTVYWLVRGQGNASPSQSIPLTLLPGETAVLEDVIFVDFGMSSGTGAFLIEASGNVIVNCRIFADETAGTLGQGFEGVPMWAFTQAGDYSDTVGLTRTADFRTNVYAIAGPDGASLALSLLEPDGSERATANLDLDPYEPYLQPVQQTFSGVGNFDAATLHAEVTSGEAVVGASKGDNNTNDPTTLEPLLPFGGPVDGTYQFAVYESSGYAAGGNLTIMDGVVTSIRGTYSNYDKVDGEQNPECEVVFLFEYFTATPVEDFEAGVSFSESYDDSGDIDYTLQFDVDQNLSLANGTIDAEGSDFSGDESGCNGTFPTLEFAGGKDP
jgi:hypothetical protein